MTVHIVKLISNKHFDIARQQLYSVTVTKHLYMCSVYARYVYMYIQAIPDFNGQVYPDMFYRDRNKKKTKM